MSEIRALLLAQLDRLRAERAAILALSGPLRAERDRLQNAYVTEIAALDEKIRALEEPMLQIDRDTAAVARGLGGHAMNKR